MTAGKTMPEEEEQVIDRSGEPGAEVLHQEDNLADEFVQLLESFEEKSKTPTDAETAYLALHGLFDSVSKVEWNVARRPDELLKSLCDCVDAHCLSQPTTFLGEKSTFLGFDKNSGQAVISRSDITNSQAQVRDLRINNGRITDDGGTVYKEIDLTPVKLYQDRDGAVFARTVDSDGNQHLSEIPSLRIINSGDERLAIRPLGNVSNSTAATELTFESSVRPLGAAESLQEYFDRVQDASESGALKPSPVAIDQSNDYANNHLLSAKIQDGFRTAGQGREFSPDGKFNAADRAATVVDRQRDEKLREIIEEAKKQFAELPPRERAKALAEYVNKLMGPANGDEKTLDERYRRLMADNAGKELLLSEFLGSGACTQRALLLKVLADELGLQSSVVRGNGGAHVWNTFKFDDGREEIFDTRARLYGIESSELHRPLTQGTANGDFVVGQRVIAEGKDWTVKGYDSSTGSVVLNRSDETKVRETDLKQLNPGKELITGEAYKVKTPDGRTEDWILQSRNSDGSVNMIRVEEKAFARADLSRGVLELGSKNADLKYLEDNWKSLVEDNPKLNDAQREALRAARETLDKSGSAKASDFRKIVEHISTLSKSSAADVQVRIDALTRVANTVGNYPNGIFPPIDTLLNAKNADALKQVAESLSQSAPFQENAPIGASGTTDLGGKGYEHAASQALQRALQDKAAVKKMIDAGKLPPGEWVYVPGAAGSALDNLKCDGMLVDLSTGKAIFIDFAMHEPGKANPYGALESKLKPDKVWRDGRPKYPFALTLDESTIGWDKTNGGSGKPILAEKILERVGSYLKGNQAADLSLAYGQDPPYQYDLAELRKALGGEMVNFGPVLNEAEAAARSEEAKKPVATVDVETAEIARKLKNNSDAKLRHLGLSADAADLPTQEKVSGSKFFNQSLRAAVELDKLKAADALYGPGKLPDVRMTVGVDNVQNDPVTGKRNPYYGKRFFTMQADDGFGGKPTEVRIYENGDVFVKTVREGDGVMARDFQNIGNVRDLKGDLAREMHKLGLDPSKQRALVDSFGDIGKNFKTLANDLDAVNKGRMTVADFWKAHPELKLLADGVENGTGARRAAQEVRPVYQARLDIEKDPALKSLDNATKDKIAAKYCELLNDNLIKKGKFTHKDVYTVLELEKMKMSTEAAIEAVNLKRAMRKDGEAWSPADVKRNYDAAKAAQAKDFPGVKELAEVHRILDLQSQLKVDAATAQALNGLRNKIIPDATISDLRAVNQMHADLKTAGVTLNVADVGKIYAKTGTLGAQEIAEIARIKPGLPALKAEDLAQHAVRNLQVEDLFGADKAKADAIRSKAADLAKAGAPLENVHDAAALMELNGTKQAEALELAKVLAEVRKHHHYPTFGELAKTANVLDAVRKMAGAPQITADLEKLVVEAIKKKGNNLVELKKFLEEELFNRSSEGEHAKLWEKVYDAVEGCKNTADLARALGLPADAAGQKAALEGFEKLFKPEVPAAGAPAPAAVTPVTLGEIDRKGLDVGKQLKAELAGLTLSTHAEVSEFLKSCLDQIDALKGDKKWKESDRAQFESLIEKYRQGDAGAVAAVNAYLDLKITTAAPSTTINPGDGGGKPPAAPETVSMAELERRLQDQIKRAEVLKKIEEEGPIRETLKKAGMSEKRAMELEKDLLSEKEEVRERAKREISKYYESRGRGGFGGFGKEVCGRLGALVMVAAVVLPFLLVSPNDNTSGPSATWSGGKGN